MFAAPPPPPMTRASILALLFAAGAAHAQPPAWTHDLGVYEVNVRQYTAEGTFDAFVPHLDRLEALGVGVLWLMPVHPIGQENRIGSLGSPYSVRDYAAVNPDLGTLEDLRDLVDAAHARGMYVILDWVANHTAWDHVYTTEHPEWYVTDAQGNFIPPPGTNWSDVIELDFGQRGLRDAMIAAMTAWVEDVGVDGFRFDAVSFVPDDFWAEATAALRAVRPDLFLLAEGSGASWHRLGFDASFAWDLYGFGNGVLVRLADGRATAANLSGFVAGQAQVYPDDAVRLLFTSNHDENAFHGTPRELFGDAAPLFDVLTLTLPGMPLIYGGEEAGLDRRLSFFDKDAVVWREHPNAARFETLLRLRRENRALWSGGAGGPVQRVLSTDNERLYAFVRQRDGDRVFVLANVSAEPVAATLDGGGGEWHDAFTGEPVSLAAGAEVSLPAWGWRVLRADRAVTAAPERPDLSGLTLEPPRPNPAASSATVAFSLARPSGVRVTLADALGRTVRVEDLGARAAGPGSVTISVAGLAPGLYLCRVETDLGTQTRRLSVAR